MSRMGKKLTAVNVLKACRLKNWVFIASFSSMLPVALPQDYSTNFWWDMYGHVKDILPKITQIA